MYGVIYLKVIDKQGVQKFKEQGKNLKVTYKGDGKNIKAKSAEKVFAIVPNAYIPGEVLFNSSSDVIVNYADGEQIKFVLKDYDDGSIIYDEKTVTVKDSKAIYSIPDNLEFNQYYDVYVIHNNVTVANDYFKVIPNMDLPNKFYSKRTYDIPVVFPEEYKNKNVTVLAPAVSQGFYQGSPCFLGFVCHVKPHSFRLPPQRWWNTS